MADGLPAWKASFLPCSASPSSGGGWVRKSCALTICFSTSRGGRDCWVEARGCSVFFVLEPLFWVASFPYAPKKPPPKKPTKHPTKKTNTTQKTFKIGKLHTSKWISYIFSCRCKLRWKVMFCVQPAVVISSMLSDSCAEWSSPATELARVEDYGSHERICLAACTVSNHSFPVILKLHWILEFHNCGNNTCTRVCSSNVTWIGALQAFCAVSCILWEGCTGCNVICVLSWFWQEYSYLGFLCSELSCISLAIACLFPPCPHVSHSGLPDVVWLSLNLQSNRRLRYAYMLVQHWTGLFLQLAPFSWGICLFSSYISQSNERHSLSLQMMLL